MIPAVTVVSIDGEPAGLLNTVQALVGYRGDVLLCVILEGGCCCIGANLVRPV